MHCAKSGELSSWCLLEKDALNGADMIQYSGIVAAWVGEKDLASAKSRQSSATTQFPQLTADLKLLPWYDPLRGDPRFEKIVNSLAPNRSLICQPRRMLIGEP